MFLWYAKSMNIPQNIQSELQQLKQEGAVAKATLVGMTAFAAIDTLAYLGGRAMNIADIPLAASVLIAGAVSGIVIGYKTYQYEMHEGLSQ